MSRLKPQHLSNDRPVVLLKKVVTGDEKAWQEFVEAYSGFLYALAWRYARGDVDVASELVLVALEGIRRPDAEGAGFYRLRMYLDSLDRFGGRSRFVTWLALVVKNLFRDWFRERDGRRLLPKEIEGLTSLDQEIFKLVFWEGLTESETFETLKSTGESISSADFAQSIKAIYNKLTKKNLLTIYQDLLRRLPAISLGPREGVEGGRLLEVPDPRPETRPDLAYEFAENRFFASELGKLLVVAVNSLSSVTRNVLMLYTVQGLSGEEIRRIMGFRKRQRVYDEIAKAKHRIGHFLIRAGVDRERAQQAEGLLEGWLKEKK